MSDYLFESPWLIGSLGILLTVLTGIGWVQSGHRVVLFVSIGMLVATILLICMNMWVVTHKERIRGMLESTASELESNQHDRVRLRLHPDHSPAVAAAMHQLPRLKFQMAQVTRVHSIELSKLGNNPTARVRMNVYVEVESNIYPGKIPRWVQLDLELKNDKWLVVDFQQKEPTFEFMGRE
jgi:hypothetical protein